MFLLYLIINKIFRTPDKMQPGIRPPASVERHGSRLASRQACWLRPTAR